MGVRLTGISTPIGGLSWEYTGSEENADSLIVSPGQKIKVFISSICGVEKYDKVRAELKNAIERTQLADVYTFEGKGASTLPAIAHYSLALKDSDICIFLIDNADGINPGVQNEIDTVEKYNIKALYYFCDETKKEKTALQQKLTGARFAKSKTVHSFDELSQDGAQALIDDIIAVYHYYCIGRIVLKETEPNDNQGIEVTGTEKYQLPTIPKATIKNVDKCKDYLLKFVLRYSRAIYPHEKEKTSEYDEWGLQFLPILFEGKSIKLFNVAMYLDTLKTQQDDEYHQIVQIRWQAIQSYFAGDIEKCIEHLKKALSLAKETVQPTWVIKDILIDLRNQHWTHCTMVNEFSDTSAQKELTESSEELYYPILDRLHESLYEKYIEGLYEKKTQSPYTVTLGNNLDKYGEILASSLIVSMYNGSLSHILLIYKRIKEFVFYLSSKYGDWNLRLNLYKLAIFEGNEKEINGIQNSYPEVLNNLTSDEASSIMDFCLNHPIKYKRLSNQLLAFGAVGYFLNDTCFAKNEEYIIDEIRSWLSCPYCILSIGPNIFKCLSGVAHRIPQDSLSSICCQFIEKHYSRWYIDMFKFIANFIDLRKMSSESAQALIEHIYNIFDNEEERKLIQYAPFFLYILKKQNSSLTESLDEKVERHFPDFYQSTYKLVTTQNEGQNLPVYISECIDGIRKRNEEQGKNGTFIGYATHEIASVRAILVGQEIKFDSNIIDELISVVADTLLFSQENISTKLDAITLLICVILKYPDDYARNRLVFQKLFDQREEINVVDDAIFSANIDSISLKIGLQFLYAAMGKDVYSDILELMPYIEGDVATTIAVTRLIVEYLDTADTITLPSGVEAVTLQYVLQWLHSEHLDIRLNATRILLLMAHNPVNHGIVNSQIIKLISSSSVRIKKLILRHLYKVYGITNETRQYVFSKCKNDANYIVRMECADVEKDAQAQNKNS